MSWKVPGFERISTVGSGPTGLVISARDLASDTVVAVKYLTEEVYGEPGFAGRFREQALALAGLECPNIVQMYGYVEGPETAAVVTELVSGGSLRRLLNAGPLDLVSALYVLKGTLLGLVAASRRGIVHGDVKPENILIDNACVIKVADFGIAARHGRRSAVTGDPRYLAPERWAGRPPTAKSDVYAASVIMLECLTGKTPTAADGGHVGQARLASVDDVATMLPLGLPDRVRLLMVRGLTVPELNRTSDPDVMLDRLELAAIAAFGPNWEEAGKAKLAPRMVSLLTRRASGSPARKLMEKPTRNRIAVAAGLVIVVVGGLVALASGIADPSKSPGRAAPVARHTPLVVVGPAVPNPSPSGPGVDKIKPQEPTGLHIAGRSLTAVTLDWTPAYDNVKVVGYIVTRNGRRVGTSASPGFTNIGLTARTKYQFAVTAFDAAGNLSPSSAAIFATTLTKADMSPPSTPTGLRSTGTSRTKVFLVWSASQDNVGVAGYDVFRDGTRITSVTQPSFTDSSLSAGTSHVYTVRAFDTSNLESGISNSVTATTQTRMDTTRPSAPTGLILTATSVTTVTFAWSAATDNLGVTGYEIFRDGVMLKIPPIVTTSFTDTGLAANTDYSYTVKALDAAGNVSPASAALAATTQEQPPPVITPTPTPTATPTDQPSSDPTTTAPPPPPTPVLVSLTVSASDIAPPPICTTEIEATLTVTGGPLTVHLSYSIDGTPGAQAVYVDDSGPVTVALGSGDGTTAGTASVEDADGFGMHDSTSWSALTACVPTDPIAGTDPGGDSGG
jgi:serine/threonine protein kinase